MKSIIYKDKSFTLGNQVFLRGTSVGTITSITENKEEKEVNLWLETFRGKTICLTLWRNKVFINSRYRGKLLHLLGDRANELY